MEPTAELDLERLRAEIASRRTPVLRDLRRADAMRDYRRLYGVDETSIAESLSQHACYLMRADAAVSGLRLAESVEWHGAVHCREPIHTRRPARTLVEWAVVAGAPLLFDDTTGFPEAFDDVDELGWRSAAAMPILVNGVAVGALLVGRTTGIPWGARERAALAHWMTMHAITNARRLAVPAAVARAEAPEDTRFGAIVGRIAIPMVVIDPDGRIELANQAFGELVRLDAHAVLGQRGDRFVVPFDGDPTAGFLEEMLAGQRLGYTVERRLLCADGTERRVSVIAARLRYEREGRASHLAVLDDVTDRPHVERTLREREEQLRQAQRRDWLSQLAGGLAHDVSNTLAAITGFASLLRDDLGADDPRRPDAEDILRVTERASELVNRLLELSEERVSDRATFDLREVLRAFASVVRRVLPTTIEWRLEVPDEEVRATIDRGQVEQALLGLVVNARDTMPTGGEIRVSLTVASLEEPGGRILRKARIAVSDSGPGISADVARRIWTPFFTTKAFGTGLGLSLGLAVFREHGGDLRLESPPGRGATFAAYMPLAEPSGAVPAPADSPAPPLRSASTGRTVLFVEDERAVRLTTTRVLERAGYRVLAVEDGEEALRLFDAAPHGIDALVTDLQMPRLSGAELIHHVRQVRPGLPVVVTSAHPSQETDDREFRSAATASLRKPFPVTVLIATLGTLLHSTD